MLNGDIFSRTYGNKQSVQHVLNMSDTKSNVIFGTLSSVLAELKSPQPQALGFLNRVDSLDLGSLTA